MIKMNLGVIGRSDLEELISLPAIPRAGESIHTDSGSYLVMSISYYYEAIIPPDCYIAVLVAKY